MALPKRPSGRHTAGACPRRSGCSPSGPSSRPVSPSPPEGCGRRESSPREPPCWSVPCSRRSASSSLTQDSIVLAYLGFAVCGGVGAGLVYATCINMVGKWYPERRGAKTGFVNGGFAYGAVPFIFIFSYALHPSTYVWVLDLVGRLHAGGRRGVRIVLQGPAEELVAGRRRPAAMGEQQVRRDRVCARIRRPSGSSPRWRPSRPACCR